MSTPRHLRWRQVDGPAHLLVLTVATLVFPSTAALGVCTEDLYEGGDTCHSAATISDGEIQPREFCEDASDWAVFNACAGRVYVLSTANLGPYADTVLELYAPDCASLVASNDNAGNAGGGGPASRIGWSAPVSGLYHVKIRQADGSSGLDRGYELRLTGDTSSCDTYSRTYALPAAATDALGTATSDGGVLVVYNGITLAGRGTEPVLLKLNASGTLDWRESLGTTSSESALRPVQTADGGFAVVGWSGTRFWIAKLNALGQIVWQRAQELFTGGNVVDVQAMPDGGIVLAGRTEDHFGIYDAFLLRLDQNGAVVWSRLYDGTPPPDQTESDDNALAVRPTRDGGLLLLAENVLSGGLEDAWIARLTPTGNVVWAASVSVVPPDFGSVAVTEDGGIAFALGTFNSLSIGKLDASGAGLWSRYLPLHAVPEGVAASFDGGMAVAFTASASGDSNGHLARFDAAGNLLWQKRYGQTGPTEVVNVLDPSPDGGFRLAGWRSGATPQMFHIKTDAEGQVLSCAPWQNATFAFTDGGPRGVPKTLVVTPRGLLDDTWTVQTGTAQAVTRVDECKCSMPPAYSGTLLVRKVSGVRQIYWSLNPYRFDVVTGSLNVLEATGGDFTAALGASAGPACLAQDMALAQVNDASAAPAPGDGAFYVLRNVDPVCLLGGSYDSLAPAQVAGRDSEIRAAPGACP